MCILLVDDEFVILALMSEILRDSGYEVVEAQDGVQAMVLLADQPHRFVILVTDFHMPGGVDGIQVAARLRELSPSVPVIIASGRPDLMQQSWRDDFGYAFLEKPYLPSKLLEAVHLLVGRPPAHPTSETCQET